MQPRNLPDVLALEPADDDFFGVDPVVFVDVPQAGTSSAMALIATPLLIVPLTVASS